jgi:hypothetical protein
MKTLDLKIRQDKLDTLQDQIGNEIKEVEVKERKTNAIKRYLQSELYP